VPKKPKISRSVAAKKKLKDHLKTHIGKSKNSSYYFTPTEAVAWYWWRVINKAAFKNKLPYPSAIIVRKLRGAWGLCLGKSRENNCVITISSEITNRKLFIATVAHEMVHQWQWYDRGVLDHASRFREWNEYFKRNFGIVL
jgi:hypothetical protein